MSLKTKLNKWFATAKDKADETKQRAETKVHEKKHQRDTAAH